MGTRPYTDEDLRAEAARQHYLLTAHLDTRRVLARMLDGKVKSTCSLDPEDGLTWDEALNCEDLDEPKRDVTELIRKAADVSEWAVDMGADGLEPTPHTITIDSSTLQGEFVRLHFAFHPDAPADARARFVAALRQGIEGAMTT